MSEMMSVLIVNKSIAEPGLLTNAAFVLGLSAGRLLPDASFGSEVVDGDGSPHRALTRIGHIVRKATGGKLRTLREQCLGNDRIVMVDYTEDAAPSDYEAYASALGGHRGEDIQYRAIHVFGPKDIIDPLTKSLSRL